METLGASPSPLPAGAPATVAAPRGLGWIIGILCGALVVLFSVAPIRYVIKAQLQYAMADNGTPMLRPLEADWNPRETALLDQAAASAPEDYLMQVGRATVRAAADGAAAHNARIGAPPPAGVDQALYRLGALATDFPLQPGAYAHLARYMMADRVRIQAGPNRGPSRRDGRLMDWALRLGERRDPENAFWPAMRAVLLLASHRENEALEALHQASHRRRWDAYLYEEILGQWRLYTAVYGDHGALQKIGPLSLVAFPHLRELRAVAALSRSAADAAERAGDENRALRIRRDLAWLGLVMRDGAQWAYEALIGADLYLVAVTDSTVPAPGPTVQTEREWEAHSAGFRALMARNHRDLPWAVQEVTNSLALQRRIDLARFDASYPGIPPGIPLVPLFGNWMAGVCILQQMGAVALAGLAGVTAASVPRPIRQRFAPLVMALLAAGMAAEGASVLSPVGSVPAALSLILCGALLSALLAASLPTLPNLRSAEEVWSRGTTVRFLLLLVPPGIALLLAIRPWLGIRHPVALLLASLMGLSRPADPSETLGLALAGAAMPLATGLAVMAWSIRRRIAPRQAFRVAFRRLTLPLLGCLAIAYVGLLKETLRLDTAASRAINEAAENDLQWVLTHSSTP